MIDIKLELGAPETNSFGEQYYPEINQLLFSKQSSEAVFKANFSELLDQEEMLYLIVGSDSGLLYEFLKRQKFSSNVQFVIVELNSVIEQLGLTVDLGREDNGNVHLTNEFFEFGLLFNFFENYVFRHKIQLVRSMSVIDAVMGSPYQLFWEDMTNRYMSFQDYITVTHEARQFDDARLYNAADNLVPIIDHRGAIEGSTAVILGGGPTLDDTIDWIKAHQKDVVIFSAARISKRLIKEQITPDFFVSVDPHNVSFDNSKGIYSFEDESILLNSYHVNQKLLSQWRGLTAYGGTKYGWKNEKYSENVGVPGPNVINTAVSFAVELGCHNIIFSGVDFCFAHGKSHESGSDEAKLSSHLGYKEVIKVEANSGEMTPTQILYASGRDSMEVQVSDYKKLKPVVKFYSMGWASAKIRGVEFVEPEKIQFLSEKTEQQIAHLKQALNLSKEQRIEKVEETLGELEQQKKRFKKIKQLSADGLKAMGKFIDKTTQQPKPKALEKVKRLRKKLDREVGDDGEWLFSYNAKNFADTFKPANEQDQQQPSTDDLAENLTGYFKGLNSVAEQLLDLIDKSKERGNIRLDELKGKAPKEIFPYWKRWGEFGRAHYWMKWHDKTTLDEDNLLILEEAERLFGEEVEKTDTKQFQLMKKQSLDLPTLIAKVDTAIQIQSEHQLNTLLDHAENFETEQIKEDFARLIQAAIAEVKQDNDTAITFYLNIVSKEVRHFALKRALNIYLAVKHYDNAMVLLEELCTFSLDYMVPYADMVALLGQPQMASEILGMYLSQHTEKTSVHLKLAQYLLDAGMNDKARQELENILQSDPDNQTAKQLLSSL